MRKELRISVLLFTIFNIVRLISDEIGHEIFILHFFLGGLCAGAFLEMVIGMLPEATYIKLKSLKMK